MGGTTPKSPPPSPVRTLLVAAGRQLPFWRTARCVCPRRTGDGRPQDARGSQTTRQSVLFPADPITCGGGFFFLSAYLMYWRRIIHVYYPPRETRFSNVTQIIVANKRANNGVSFFFFLMVRNVPFSKTFYRRPNLNRPMLRNPISRCYTGYDV